MANRELRFGATVLLAVASAAVLAPWLSRGDPALQYDPVHGANLPPGSRRVEIVATDGSRLLSRQVETTREGLVAWFDSQNSGAGPQRHTIPASSVRRTAQGELTRERLFLLGTDRVGRDLWTRLVHGSRVSLLVALLAALLASLVGIVVGSAAVSCGRLVDVGLMRITDGFLAFPRLFLLLALAAFLDAGAPTVIVILGVTSWMSVARIVRAELLRLEASDLALAARASGAGRFRVLLTHLLPNIAAPVVVATTLRIGDVLLLEAALSFLGLGVRPPTPSWGNMIADGAPDLATAWWTSTLPGVAIVLTVVAFNLVGDSLQERAQRSNPADTTDL